VMGARRLIFPRNLDHPIFEKPFRTELDSNMSTNGSLLPEQFSSLERFVGDWDLPTEAERSARRHRSSFDELKEYYGAVIAKGKDALEYLHKLTPETMTEADHRLFLLTLSLAEVAPAVELFNAVEEEGVYDVTRVRAIHDKPS